MELFRRKGLLLACTVMLALQFCFPLVVRAGSQTQVAEMISLGVKDAETKVDAPTGLEFPTAHLVAWVQEVQSEGCADRQLTEPGRASDPLLTTTGRYPSAP